MGGGDEFSLRAGHLVPPACLDGISFDRRRKLDGKSPISKSDEKGHTVGGEIPYGTALKPPSLAENWRNAICP
jgi:hypothetical protein